MAKWKDDKGPALWPIDMSLISRVHFVAIPQTDVDLEVSNITDELDVEPAKYSWQAIESAEDPKTDRFINLICERLGRRTPYCFEGDKGELNTDVLRAILEKTIPRISSNKTNPYGIAYTDLSGKYIDVEYETIFGNTKITITKYDQDPSSSIIIVVKCNNCMVTRTKEDTVANIDYGKMEDIVFRHGPFSHKVDSSMEYSMTVTTNGMTRSENFILNRPLEFVYSMEPLTFLEDGPKQVILPAQQPKSPFYLDDAKFSIKGPNGQLELNGVVLKLGSIRYCKANIVRTFFKRANSNLHKRFEFEDVYYTMGDHQKQWGEPGVAKTFGERVSAARIKLNSEIAIKFGLGDIEVFKQQEKELFINPDCLSPLKKKA